MKPTLLTFTVSLVDNDNKEWNFVINKDELGITDNLNKSVTVIPTSSIQDSSLPADIKKSLVNIINQL